MSAAQPERRQTAALSMYDRAETAAANDRLWAAIRAELGHGPQRLTRDRDLWEVWTDPGLVLAQTCGLPFRARLHDKVALIGTPDYGLPGCAPGYYHSTLVARADDPRDLAGLAAGTMAVNEGLSQSGWAAPLAYLAARNLSPARCLRTGAHRASARAVTEGGADLASLDSVTWALIRRHDAWAGALREVATTPPTPGLPLIAARGTDAPRLRAVVEAAIEKLAPQDRDILHLCGVVHIPASEYLAQPIPPAPTF
ncbi:PhnD/SsuA/transferrin family substrate-binding protein [Aliiroseovarius sp.]|uniref:phosphate/phosphite/phosphonate ABC transporter substrate-binding protein n=1 Tax=Aliiroseovarius sp. TaxID=1872442 RepID=UPI00260478EA|nr:PhnD/SsuA/transferrin family substrate-binding protein [Aliiroseovarius sp.]